MLKRFSNTRRWDEAFLPISNWQSVKDPVAVLIALTRSFHSPILTHSDAVPGATIAIASRRRILSKVMAVDL
jgi:hypothetical protein